MICPTKELARIYVVDAHPNDYSTVVDESAYDPVRFTFFSNARDALRNNPEDDPQMWIVNMTLPDMPGTDLYGMLRNRGSAAPIMLVGDQYSVQDEITARTSGATMYVAKPLRTEWVLPEGASSGG